MKRWDIFCKIVDNFGDIGVCWRLARQLQQEHGLQVRLWVDDMTTAQRLIPELDLLQLSQICASVEIKHWHAQADFSQAADVVIEAFACDLPAQYLTVMRAQKSKWVNLEYLSAEDWVVDFHAKPSPKQGLTRYFYFPGFVEQSGGLIREQNLKLNQPPPTRQLDAQAPIWDYLQLTQTSSLKVSLFCYPHAPIASLFDVMANAQSPITCLIPESSILPTVAEYFGKQTVKVGDSLQQQQLNVRILPFLSQAQYDLLLAACDINFVRGEDSWVRAIWAKNPFVWQPYRQEEQAHLPKLEAFLTQFYSQSPSADAVRAMHQAWVSGQISTLIWDNYMNTLQITTQHTNHMSQQLAVQPDLATRLVDFCRHT
jgi:uncharacterized repeat protein (TIGR03837 family)